jgi:hypothetical protein
MKRNRNKIMFDNFINGVKRLSDSNGNLPSAGDVASALSISQSCVYYYSEEMRRRGMWKYRFYTKTDCDNEHKYDSDRIQEDMKRVEAVRKLKAEKCGLTVTKDDLEKVGL